MLADRLPRWGFALLAVAPMVTGCTQHAIPAPAAQISPLTGRFETGTIVAVRAVDAGSDINATNAILSALNEQPISGMPKQAVEILIRRQDNTVTSIVQQQQIGQTGLLPGQKVAIVEAAATVIRGE